MSQQVDIKAQAGKVLGQVAGYIATKTIDIGLKQGLFSEIARHPDGISANELAERIGVDRFYTQVWLRAAYAAEIIDCENPLPREDYDPVTRRFSNPNHQKFRLAPHMEDLLLNEKHPAYIGGLPAVMQQPEIFDLFANNLSNGEHIWWCDCSPQMIQCVSCTGLPFYTRLIPGGFSKVPGLEETLRAGGKVVEVACGAGRGLELMARTYPEARLVGVDGDQYSLELARQRLVEAGLSDRVELVYRPLEEMDIRDSDVVFINISMHECRDIDRVTKNIHDALKPGGLFVISDFPFPESLEKTRSVPGRILTGIQYFESLIDDQLMPTVAFIELLKRHSFENAASFDITPVHAVSYATKPA